MDESRGMGWSEALAAMREGQAVYRPGWWSAGPMRGGWPRMVLRKDDWGGEAFWMEEDGEPRRRRDHPTSVELLARDWRVFQRDGREVS